MQPVQGKNPHAPAPRIFIDMMSNRKAKSNSIEHLCFNEYLQSLISTGYTVYLFVISIENNSKTSSNFDKCIGETI